MGCLIKNSGKLKSEAKRKALRNTTWAWLFVFSFILILLSINVEAGATSIGVLPAVKNFDDSNSIITTTVYVRNSGSEDYEVSVSTSGELADFATVSKNSFESKSKTDTPIECKIDTSKTELSYGPNSLYINFLASPKESAGTQKEQITALPAVTARITINVPYPGRYLDLRLSSISTATEGLIEPTLLYSNMGEEKIKELSCQATVLDDTNNKVMAEMQKSNILKGSSGEFAFKLRGEFSSGNYPLYIVCNFDGEEKIFEENVNIIGTAVEVISARIEDGMYNVTIKNRGRAKYSIVYAKVKLVDENNNEIASFNTVPHELTESETINLEGFSGFEPEKLNVTKGKIILELNYDSFQSEHEFSYESGSKDASKPPKIAENGVWFIVFIVAVLLVAFLIVRSIAKNKDEYY